MMFTATSILLALSFGHLVRALELEIFTGTGIPVVTDAPISARAPGDHGSNPTGTITLTETETSTTTSTWTGLTTSFTTVFPTGTSGTFGPACSDPSACVTLTETVTASAIIFIPAPTRGPATSTTVTAATSAPTQTSPSASVDQPSSSSPPAPTTTSSELPALKPNHSNRTQALIGGILGGLAAVGIAVAILFMLRRRRLQKRQRDSRWLVDPATMTSRESEGPASALGAGAPVGHGEYLGEKAVLLRAELERQLRVAQEEVTTRRLTMTGGPIVQAASASETGGSTTTLSPEQQLAILTARVKELENQQRQFALAEIAPPDYFAQVGQASI
ncbi:hypothetical protein B0H16DRAFT_788557 [Mycena metata]|uniref:Mid2 domain-containing protein n=1 Tax=Mycena metata TaxID=1033252 RepID=A0AAD7IXL8_9AGAR|nr:hypothetical protein B0H16DRAFT_788557 [Mycena metata]